MKGGRDDVQTPRVCTTCGQAIKYLAAPAAGRKIKPSGATDKIIIAIVFIIIVAAIYFFIFYQVLFMQ